MIGAACAILWNHERWGAAAALAGEADWSAVLHAFEERLRALMPAPSSLALAARAVQLLVLPALLVAALTSSDALGRRAAKLFAGAATLALLADLFVPQRGPGAAGPLPAAGLPLARLLGAEH